MKLALLLSITALGVTAMTVNVPSAASTRPLADPICVGTDPVAVIGYEIVPAISECLPTA